MIQQAANPSATTTIEAANTGSGNEETADENLTATTAAATPCPEICEQTQNTGECPTGKHMFLNTIPSSANKILSNTPNYKEPLVMSQCKFDKLQLFSYHQYLLCE